MNQTTAEPITAEPITVGQSASVSKVFGISKLTTALLDRLPHHCHTIEKGKESYRYKQSAKQRR